VSGPWLTEDFSVIWIDREEFPLMRDATAEVRRWMSDIGHDDPDCRSGRGRPETAPMCDEHEAGWHAFDEPLPPCTHVRRVWRYEPTCA
jgi:hypothetical protein